VIYLQLVNPVHGALRRCRCQPLRQESGIKQRSRKEVGWLLHRMGEPVGAM